MRRRTRRVKVKKIRLVVVLLVLVILSSRAIAAHRIRSAQQPHPGPNTPAVTKPTNTPLPPLPNFVVRSAVLMEATTGQILFEQNADQSLPTASTAKIMTMRLAFRAIKEGRLSLEREVYAPPEIIRSVPWDSSLMYINPGSSVKVRDLLFGLAVDSGNDAAVVIANAIAGSVPAFVDQMNAEAAALGMKQTHFVDPHGYSPATRASARDMAALTRAYLRDAPESLEYHSAQSFTYGKDTRTGESIIQYNHNYLLWDYEGADGLKTGFTDQAGYNLLATAKRNGVRVLGVVMGVPSRGVGSLRGMAYRDQVMTTLLDRGFAMVAPVEVPGTATASSVTTYKGTKSHVTVAPAETVIVPQIRGKELPVTTRVELSKTYLVAPVARGQAVGTLVVMLGGKEYLRLNLVTTEAVKRGGFIKVMWDSMGLALAPLVHRGLGVVTRSVPAGR